MEFFRMIEGKILLFFAHLFKIQSNWFFEILGVLACFVLIGVLIGLLFFLHDLKQSSAGPFKWMISFYVILSLTLSVIFFTVVHVVVVSYLVLSGHDFRDFTVKDEQIREEFLNVNIYDHQGNKIYTVINNDQNREVVSLNEIPADLENAFVDIEDKDFYSHQGFSIRGYLRAVYYKVKNPSNRLQGGSTLTQQLIKNANGSFDQQNRGLLNKYQEAFLSVIIENKYDKEEILEMYMNRIYLGKGNIHGVGTAAKYYFNKHISDLTLAESAFLAGLPQAPSLYTENLEEGNKRKNTVLTVMKENGSITENQWKIATEQVISFVPQTKSETSYEFDSYVDYVLKEAKELYDVSENDLKQQGYNIYTYLDTNLQRNMYQTAQNYQYQDDTAKDKVQPAIAAVNSDNNKLIALYGGRDYIRGYNNRVYERYQPGSILKPLIVYGPAFETEQWNPFSEVIDEKQDFGNYSPSNYAGVYEGSITIERALIRSANIPAVSVMKEMGIEKGISVLEKMNIPVEEKDRQLHISLGGMEKGVTAIEMAQAYAVFQNFGYFEPSRAIKFIKDEDGDYVEENKKSKETKGEDIFSPENAYHMTEILRKVISDPNGTGRFANIGRPLAGKTGTAEQEGTSGNKSTWFVGYTPDISMAVHIGFDEPSKERFLTTTGGGDPAKLFSQIMKSSLMNTPVKEFKKPNDVMSIAEGPTLTRIEKVHGDYDKETNQIVLNWDVSNEIGGLVYQVYKKNEDGEDLLVSTTTEPTYKEAVTTEKITIPEPHDEAPFQDKWLFYLEQAKLFFKGFFKEKHSYYVVSTYEDKISEPSDEESVRVPKIEVTNGFTPQLFFGK